MRLLLGKVARIVFAGLLLAGGVGLGLRWSDLRKPPDEEKFTKAGAARRDRHDFRESVVTTPPNEHDALLAGPTHAAAEIAQLTAKVDSHGPPGVADAHAGGESPAGTDPQAADSHAAETHAAADPHASQTARGGKPPAHPVPAAAAQSSSNLLQRADELIAEGMHASALRLLKMLLVSCSGESALQVRFRIGLCSEQVGDFNEAHAQYQAVLNGQTEGPIARQAIFGQIRLWNATDRRALSVSTLLRQLAGQATAPPAWSDEAWHLLGLSLAGELAPASAAKPLDDRVLLASEPVVRAEEVLIALRLASVPATERPAGEVVATRKLGSVPEQVWLRASISQRPVREVLESIAQSGRWSLAISPRADDRLLGRTTRIEVNEADAAFLLDASLADLDLGWQTSGSSIRIFDLNEVPVDLKQQLRLAQAQRVLQSAIREAPTHRWACHSYVALGRLAAQGGRVAESLRLHQQASELFPNAECRGQVWINSAKLLLLLGRREEALKSFYRAVDSVEAQQVKQFGYLYVGRMHLENGEPERAVPSLMRALALSERTTLEPMAAGMLSSGLLLDRNPSGANAVLMKRRQMLGDSNLRDQAAMLSSLARFEAAADVDARHREAGVLMESLAHVDPATMFGGHWWCLVVDGLRKTGVIHEADRVRDECLRRTQHFPLRDRLLMSAIEDRVKNSSVAEAGDALRTLAGPEAVLVKDEVRLLDARTAFRNGLHDAALERCEALVRDVKAPTETRRNALRLMGQIYQMREDYHSAVACFAGTLPQHPNQVRPIDVLPSARRTAPSDQQVVR